MEKTNNYHITIAILCILPLFLMGWKINRGYLQNTHLIPDDIYKVKMNFSLQSDQDQNFVKAYLPQSNIHQSISDVGIYSDSFNFKSYQENENLLGVWTKSQLNRTAHLSYNFKYQGKAMQYKLDHKITLPEYTDKSIARYLLPSEHIQSDHEIFRKTVDNITFSYDNLTNVVAKVFSFTHRLKNKETNKLTDAITALKDQQASCNDKTRLFVALCRSYGIPSRVVGGIVLNESEKKTSHLWSELYLENQWVPFDPFNGHFAYLPSNYLELYKGDHFLLSGTKDIQFDYDFNIEKETIQNSQNKTKYTLWSLVNIGHVPYNLLKLILLLPFCSLIIAILRNVIGLKTFGVFLPAIISVAIDSVGLGMGIVLYMTVVMIVGILHFPLTKWGLLYTPKLVIMLVAVVICILSLTLFGVNMGWTALGSLIFFPIIILSIASEKFAKTILEDGFEDAIKKQLQTLVAIVLCYMVYSADFIGGFFVTFPEVLILIASVMILLGRWIGLRISEYNRFALLFK